ncbi:methylated-DNA--[protein]-cysteine S-methyltransferase [Neglectibacter caecimuris]|uniref:methylated-DNA--[protein]-cysteine S-methyltransferase n=1 Tax=Neglectibacter caecimuris TaxID=3093658 RepID=UPI00345F1C0C
MKRMRWVDSPIGALRLAEEDGALTELLFGRREDSRQRDDSPVLLQAEVQLGEYFAGKRREFTVPLSPRGTEFQRRVWNALLTIPYGETRSYGEIAILAESPKAFRAVGSANHNNPISILIPCHRVIGKNGSLTGYGGGMEAKQFLLELEKGNGELAISN